MPYTNVIKRRECHRRYYLRNKELYKNKNIRRKNELIDFVVSLKKKPCMDCGKKYPHYVMDFDHRDGKTKLSTVNRMVHIHMNSKRKISEEIAKCDLVCANCHRTRTHKLLRISAQ